jgi:hypothetical protein
MNQNHEEIKKEDKEDSVKIPLIQIVLPPVVNLPCIHHAKFAELNGLPEGVIGGWLDSGYLPTVKIGRYTMINLVLLTERLKQGGDL